MTREETIKCIEVMQAYVDGEEIEELVSKDSDWRSVQNPEWDWDFNDYRKKPQSMKVTEEEKKIIGRSLIWTKCKKTGHVDYYLTNEIDSYRNKFYILNSDTMEWQE